MRETGEIKCIGTEQLKKRGRPEDVYFNGTGKVEHVKHEVFLTRALLKYAWDSVKRLHDVDPRIAADAECVRNGFKFFFELDRGVSYPNMERRWKKYEGVEDYLLVITTTERRKVGVIEHSKAVAGIGLFTTLDEVLNDPFGEVWVDCFGKRVSLKGV